MLFKLVRSLNKKIGSNLNKPQGITCAIGKWPKTNHKLFEFHHNSKLYMIILDSTKKKIHEATTTKKNQSKC